MLPLYRLDVPEHLIVCDGIAGRCRRIALLDCDARAGGRPLATLVAIGIRQGVDVHLDDVDERFTLGAGGLGRNEVLGGRRL
jgi:hypothetical protein